MTMTHDQFVQEVERIASFRTVYIKGGIATYISKRNIQAMQGMYPSWYTNSKIKERFEPKYEKNYWGFDCSGLIKAAVWGFTAQKAFRSTIGYSINGLPDFPVGTYGEMSEVAVLSTDWSDIMPGEILFTPGHVGVYVGDGLAVECTPSWSGGVQYTCVGNLGKIDGYNTRNWGYHGKLRCIRYLKEEKESEGDTVNIEMKVLKKGAKDKQVKTLQRLLFGMGYEDQNGDKLVIDGSFGGKTDFALRCFQNDKGLAVDGSCGAKTWEALLHG